MIPFIRAATLAALVLLVGCQLNGRLASAKSPVRVLDESEPLDIEAIARIMCESKSKRDGQISRLSTVDKLVEFFDQQVSGESHEFNKCKQKHGEALRLLQRALNASKKNVCSAEKMALIEDFHNKFVSRLVKHKKSRKEEQREAAPQLLRLFFMHYAMEVDAVCRRNLVKNVESDLKQKLGDNISDKLFELKDQSNNSQARAPFSGAFKNMMQKFTNLNPVDKCEDVLMAWDLIENSHSSSKQARRDELTIKDALDPQTGEPIRIMVKLRSPGPMNAIKEHCHYNFKPIYSKLVLPIIKLADLGYTNNGQLSKSESDQVKPSEEVKRWIRVTQMCEALLPIKFYRDASLGPKDVAVITRREAAKLDAAAGKQRVAKPKVQLVYEPHTNSMASFDRIESAATVDPKRLIKSVESNARARRHVIGRTVIRLLRNLSGLLATSRLGHIFVPKPTDHNRSGAKDGQVVVVEGEKVEVSEQLGESLENLSDGDIERLANGAPTGGKLGGLAGKLFGHAPARRLSDLIFVQDSKMSIQEKVMLAGFILVGLAPTAFMMSLLG